MSTSMHELVTEDNVQAIKEAAAQDPESVIELNESRLPQIRLASFEGDDAFYARLLRQDETLRAFQ